MTMISPVKKLALDKITLWGFLFGFAELVIFFVWIYFFTSLHGQSIALHYNVYFGIDLLGPAWAYLLPIALSFLVWTINLILALWAVERELLAARLLAWFGTSLITLILIATIITKWILK